MPPLMQPWIAAKKVWGSVRSPWLAKVRVNALEIADVLWWGADRDGVQYELDDAALIDAPS
jgi:hypothetical protein